MFIKRLMIWTTALIYWGCIVVPIFYVLLEKMDKDYQILYFFVVAILIYLIIYRLMIAYYYRCKQREMDMYGDIQERRMQMKKIKKEKKLAKKEQKRAAKAERLNQKEEQPGELQEKEQELPLQTVSVDINEPENREVLTV